MDPRQALKAYRDNRLDGQLLLRVLARHDGWRMLAIREDDGVRPLLRVVGENRWLQVFTDEHAFETHMRQAGEKGGNHDHVVTTGTWLFEHLDDGLAGLDINPLLDDAIHYKQDQFALLRDWARSIRVEAVLKTQDTSEEAAQLLAEARFYLAYLMGEEGAQLALAPDPEHSRQFAAIFTAPDAAMRYAEQAKKALKQDLKLNAMAGATLFRHLSQMPLDGLVFNCLGPPEPVAVHLDFARSFL